MSGAKAVANNLPRPLVPRPLPAMPDPETHQTMLQDDLVYAVVHSSELHDQVVKRSIAVPTPFSCSLTLEIVAASPEMLLPSANFAETCVRRLISQKKTSLTQTLRCCSSPILLFHHCFFTLLHHLKKQKTFYNTPILTDSLVLHGRENESVGEYR